MQSRISPFRAVRIGNVKPGDCDCLDLVGLFGHEPLDGGLIVVVEDRWHGVGGGGGGSRSYDIRTLPFSVGIRIWRKSYVVCTP